MFRPSAFVLLSAFTKLVLALNQGDLSISLKAVESSVKTVEDVIITAVVSNPTKGDVRVLAVNNVLDTSATKSFVITSSDGKEVPFAGVDASFDFSHESLFVNIPAGQSVAVNHTVASTFDFSSFAPGSSFKFTSRSNVFQAAPNDEAITVDINSVDVTVTDSLSFQSPFTSPSSFVSTPTCSDGGKQQVIADSLKYARSLAGGAAADIRNNPNGPRWNNNFGGNNRDDIWYNLDRVAGDQTSRGIYCQQDHADARSYCTNNPGVIAYTVVGGSVTPIYVCELFFQAGTTPSICDTHSYDSTMSSRGGIILHELSHAVFGAADVTYGCDASSRLSPADKKRNADSYRCFGLNVYLEWNCVHGPRSLEE
ncbi:zincin [Marasmius fiardii PR-910]|nr:zincin [Marasmius fiardii PR-910]